MTESRHNRFDYIEFPASTPEELIAAKKFYGQAFGWEYKDWAPVYADTQSSGVTSGIAVDASRAHRPLPTVHSVALEASRAAVLAAGGKISVEIFSFPGGRRFHFIDPAGNELAVWSET